MPFICPHNGHVDNDPDGAYCGDHGRKFFSECPTCGGEWSVAWDPKSFDGEKGTDFCSHCGTPAPWVSRRKLVQWLKDAGSDLEPAKRLELQEILDRIADMSPDDDKALAGWEKVRALAPKVWKKAKPVIGTLLVEALKKKLWL